MRTRFTLDPSTGLLVDRNGASIGVITAITLDLAPNALENMRAAHDLRERLLERAGYACERCGYNNEDALQMHHRTYERLGAEDLDDVELLCGDCHKAEHDRLAAAGRPLRRPERQRGTIGGNTSNPSETTEGRDVVVGRGVGEPESQPTPAQLEAQAIDRIWAFYLEVFPSRKRLDEKRKRIIRTALRLVDEDAVKKAIVGLSRSPHHNGQNDQRRKYLEIRYALKGIGDESDDERIEKAISWAAIYAPNGSAQVDEAKIQRWLEEVRYTASLPHRPERERGLAAYHKLRGAGFKVAALDKPPWARLTRA